MEPGKHLPSWCFFQNGNASSHHRARCSCVDRCRCYRQRLCCLQRPCHRGLLDSADCFVMFDHTVNVFAVTVLYLPRCSARTCVRRCMRVALNQQKKGLLAPCCRLIKSMAAADVSSSTVSILFFVSGPVSSIFCLPTFPKRGSTVASSSVDALSFKTPRGPNFVRYAGSFG